VNTSRSDEDRLKLMELMVLLLQKGACVDIGITAAHLSSYCCQANSDAAKGFEQIIDFLSGSYIHYALTFWNTASVKRSGDVTRLQALVDKKKILISEAVIREILQLNDAEGVVCLPNEEIFAGVETPLFEGMLAVRQPIEEEVAEAQVQLDVAVDAAVEAHVAEDVSHDAILSPPPHVIPSPSQEPSSPPQQQQSSPQAPPQDAEFPTQLQYVLNVCSALSKPVENLETANAAQKLEIIQLKARVKKLEKANKLKSSKLKRLRKVGTSRRVESSDDMEDVFNQGRMIDQMDMDEWIELVKDAKVAESEGRNAAEHAEKQAEIYNLDLDQSSKVLISAASTTIPAASATIPVAKPTIPAVVQTIAETPKVKDKGKGILVETPKAMKKKDQIEMDAEYAKKLQEEINKDYEKFSKDIDWDAAMDHVNQKSSNPQYIKRYQGMKKRPQTESQALKNIMIYLKNTAGYKMDFFKGMTYAQIYPIFQARFDENIRFLFKSREEMEAEDQEIIKSLNETPAQKETKRRKLSKEAQEAEDLRKRLEVVENKDDDVFVEATPLASKVPVVDYQIVLI
nr:hypothetical protein [Tanacetum cinerariifolium]